MPQFPHPPSVFLGFVLKIKCMTAMRLGVGYLAGEVRNEDGSMSGGLLSNPAVAQILSKWACLKGEGGGLLVLTCFQ